MNGRHFLLLITLSLGSHFCQVAVAQKKDVVSFSFNLATSARTSAGVYAKDSTLLRTLWSGVSYSAGTHNQVWDGLDDEGRRVSDGSYTVRVLSNNVTYAWEGVIGNTSAPANQGNALQRGFLRTQSMAITGTTAYCGAGYAEGNPSQSKFARTNPQTRVEFSPKGETGQATLFVATDGTTVYWAGYDGYSNGKTWFVYGTHTNDDKEKWFIRGTPLKMVLGKTYSSCVDVINEENGTITGLAVQKNGNYLFVSHKARHQILVFNKNTGALVQTLFFNDAAGLAIDGQDNLWVINGTTVKKHAVQANGTLAEPSLSLTGLESPLALAVSPDDATVLVADGGNSQQVKAFNNRTGAMTWTLGQAGGYTNDPTVTNDKFYFSDKSGVINDTFVAFEADGSFWIGDSGNYRMQHYSATRNFVDRIQYMQHSYSSAVDQTNPKRIFCQYLEFAVDYSKPLASSWTLVKNWRATIPRDYFDVQNINHTFISEVFKSVTTLSNGRTYGLLKQVTTNKWNLVELPASGPVRFTGMTFDNAPYYIGTDGSFNRAINQPAGIGGRVRWQKQPLAGFDDKNNPIWSNPLTMASIPTINATDPVDFTGFGSGRPGLTTSSGVIVSFNSNKISKDKTNGYGFHLGGVKLGTNKWAWRTAYATSENYKGDFPLDGAFDVGNGVEYGGGDVTVNGRHIFWSYHGEFWKDSQTNKWNHVYDNGLFIGQFGVLGTETGGQAAFPGMGGNVLYGSAVAVSDGNIYVWHAEESGHSGVHRWKVSGLETIREQVIPVSLTRTQPHGLLGTYAEGSDLNNANIRKSQVDKTIDFTWSDVPFSRSSTTSADYSVRWGGFVKPLFPEAYTFYVTANKGVRLWVDNKLVIDQVTASTMTEHKGQLTLEADKQYAIRLESYGGSRVALSWSSNSQAKQVIAPEYLYPANEADTTKGIDLLEGLQAGSVLGNNLYGWQRNPVQEDYSDLNSKYWSATTKVKTYDRFSSPDLYLYFRQNKANYSITRDLGELTNPRVGWRLLGSISQEGSFFSINEGSNRNGGSYIEVLDDEGKIITRIDCQVSLKPSPVGRVYGNDKIIAQGDYFNSILPVFSKTQPLDIIMVNGNAVIKYGPYAPVTTGLFDPTANWHKPKTLRLYFWGSGYNLNRIIGVERMRFFSDNNPTVVLLSANDELNTLEASNPLGASSNILVSENGGPFTPYTGAINVGNEVRPEGYWQFKVDLSAGNELTGSPAFTADGGGKLTVYPNPTQGILQIQHPVVSGDCVIDIFSVDGKQLMSWIPLTGTTVTTIDVTNFLRGIYIIRFKKNQSKLSTRFIR